MDLLSSIAKLVDSKVRVDDSQELLNVFLGQSQDGREDLIIEATTRTAYRNGDWVLIPPYKGPKVNTFVNIELGNSNEYLLYNIKEDLGQQNNLAESNPEKSEEMIKLYTAKRGTANTKVKQLELK